MGCLPVEDKFQRRAGLPGSRVHAVVARRVLGSGASGLVAIVAGSNPLRALRFPYLIDTSNSLSRRLAPGTATTHGLSRAIPSLRPVLKERDGPATAPHDSFAP